MNQGKKAFLAGLFLGSITGHLLIVYLDILKDWQQLIGAFFGASVPLVVFYLTIRHERLVEERKKREREDVEYKDHLTLLERHIVWAINNINDLDRMLHSFLNEKLKEYKGRINEDDRAGRYSVGQAFLPLTYIFVLDDSLLERSTKSLFLENALMHAISISRDMPSLIKDMSRQFDRTLALNTQLGLIQVNSSQKHNEVLSSNLVEFEIFTKSQMLEHNIPIYVRALITSKVALRKMHQLGFEKWTENYNFGMEGLSTDDKYQKMEDIFTDEINAEIDLLQATFKSKLIHIGEKTPYQSTNNLE